MKSTLFVALVASVSALQYREPNTLLAAAPPAAKPAASKDDGKVHMFEYNNAGQIWKNDWNYYRNERENIFTCKLAESDNYMGAQQCKYNWECRGARTCERGGWCSGYDGCEGTLLPLESPGLEPHH